MRYKTIMLDIESYARLSRAKEALRGRSGLKLSFNDLLMDLVSRKLDFAPMDSGLKRFIEMYAARMGKLEMVDGVLLFGSVAKGTYGKHSDIDVLVVVRDKKGKVLEKVLAAAKELREEGARLMEQGLPSLITPVVLGEEDLTKFRPFYFDFADYGIILYERGNTLSDFIYSLKRMKYRRERVNNVEVVTW